MTWANRASWCGIGAIPLLACSSPDAPRETFAGEYEVVEHTSQLDCAGPTRPEPIEPKDRWFRLRDEELAGQPLAAYYHCTAPGTCEDIYDLARSVGDGPDGWSLHVSIAGGTPCRLTFRRRVLERTADGVRYVIDVHQQVDDALSPDRCTSDEARARGRAMPCVDRRALRAVKR